jgi:hypothetical protein
LGSITKILVEDWKNPFPRLVEVTLREKRVLWLGQEVDAS